MKTFVVLFLTMLLHMNIATSIMPTAHSEKTSDKPISSHSEASPNYDSSFNAQIDYWVKLLAKEQEFESWKESQWTSAPLGPGMHGFIILIYDGETEVGYLIVHSTPEGQLQLTEYGVGEYPMFSLNTLYRTLVLHELIPKANKYEKYIEENQYHIERIYLNPFQAVWKLSNQENIYYFDAITGEAFPLREKLILQLQKKLDQEKKEQSTKDLLVSNQAAKLDDRKIIPVFDPYDQLNWISREPLHIVKPQDLLQSISSELPQITYTALIFDDLILVPLAIVGYHHWNENIMYINIDQQGLRFVPVHDVLKQGQFFLRK